MSYAQLAVYDAVVAIEGGYQPYGAALSAPAGASAEAAVVQAPIDAGPLLPGQLHDRWTRRGHRRSR